MTGNISRAISFAAPNLIVKFLTSLHNCWPLMIDGAYTKIVNVGIVGYQRIEIGEIANDLIQVPHGGRGSILVNGVNRVQSDVGGIAGEVGGSLDNTFDTSLSDDTSLVRRRLLPLQPESALRICRRGWAIPLSWQLFRGRLMPLPPGPRRRFASDARSARSHPPSSRSIAAVPYVSPAATTGIPSDSPGQRRLPRDPSSRWRSRRPR
jgi:hypothetical protein